MAFQPGLTAPPGAAAMTFFPLVLIPTFAVPLGFILHIYSIRRTLRNPAADRRGRPAVKVAPSGASAG